MSTRARRKPNGTAPDPVRSIRCPDATWVNAKRRAAYDGVTVSHVLNVLLEGYATRQIDLPTVTVTYATASGE